VHFHENAGFDSIMYGVNNSIVSIKFINESELKAKPPFPEDFMVML